MVLNKPDYDSNDCEFLNRKATPSILAIEAWLVRVHVGWTINRISYYSIEQQLRLAGCWQVDSWLEN